MSKTERENNGSQVSRRNILLGGTTLAAASAIASDVRVHIAEAQQPSATAGGKKPNILMIMADDIGWRR